MERHNIFKALNDDPVHTAMVPWPVRINSMDPMMHGNMVLVLYCLSRACQVLDGTGWAVALGLRPPSTEKLLQISSGIEEDA